MEYSIEIEGLNEKQIELFDAIIDTPASETKYHIIRASRQSGKSFLIIRLALMFAFQKPNQRGALVSASFKQFMKVFKDIIDLCEDSPSLIEASSSNANYIKFANGTRLQFYTAKNYNAIVGETMDFLICDEVALYPNGALGFITPVLAAKKNAKAVFASTPRGKNEFYEYCMRGMDTSQTFYRQHRMSYLDNAAYDLREVEEKRKSLPENVFKTEYLGEFAFGKGAVFGEFSIHQTIKEWPSIIPNMQYYAGIDWAGSGEDETSLCIIDSNGRVSYMYETESNNIPQQIEEILPILKRYNCPLTYSECNGLGLGATELLQTKITNVNKFWASNTSKNDIVSVFLMNLNNNGIKLPTINLYPKLDTEMVAFVVARTSGGALTYRHSDGFHDDAVDSLLFANYARNKMAMIGGVIFDTDAIEPEEIKEGYFKMRGYAVPSSNTFADYLYDD